MLLLYFVIGRRLSQKVAAENWGAKVIEQISADLQKGLVRLRGFSYRNLKNMRQFADEYAGLPFLRLLTQGIQSDENQMIVIGQLTTAQFEGLEAEVCTAVRKTRYRKPHGRLHLPDQHRNARTIA